MKITYEFERDDLNDLHVFEIANPMYNSLVKISEYIRNVYKGRISPDSDELIETIQTFISESRIDEIP